MTLWIYVLKSFLRSLAAVFAVVAFIVMLFTAVENLRRFGGSDARMVDILKLTLLESPEVLYQIFALVLMLASLVTFLRLSRTSELVVIRAAGVSAIRLIMVPTVSAVILAVVTVTAFNPFVAATMKQTEALQDRISGNFGNRLSFSSEGLWLRQGDADGQTVIQAERSNPDGTILRRVRMHQFNSEGALTARIDAQTARLAAGSWVLSGAQRWDLTPEGGFVIARNGGELVLDTHLTSDQILDSFSAPEMVGFWQLGSFIGQMEDSGFSGQRHRLFLQSELAKPALFAAMVLIGSAFALRPSRFGQTGVMILFAVLAGFSLYFLKDFSESLGASGNIPLSVAAWTPPIAAILLAMGLLLHLEDG